MIDDESSGEHLLANDCARMANVSTAAIRAAVADGRIKAAHVTPGGVHLFHKEEAIRFTAARQEYAKLKGNLRNVWK